MNKLTQRIEQYLSENPTAITLDIAEEFNLPEGEVLLALPERFVRSFAEERAEEVLHEITSWGEVTTIIEKFGSIFEIKSPFPSGILGRGYYNLNMKGEEGALYGHLKLDHIAYIAFVSLPFRGKESYHIAFINQEKHTIFKVYLGRDAKHGLFPEQVEKFKHFT